MGIQKNSTCLYIFKYGRGRFILAAPFQVPPSLFSPSERNPARPQSLVIAIRSPISSRPVCLFLCEWQWKTIVASGCCWLQAGCKRIPLFTTQKHTHPPAPRPRPSLHPTPDHPAHTAASPPTWSWNSRVLHSPSVFFSCCCRSPAAITSPWFCWQLPAGECCSTSRPRTPSSRPASPTA